MNKSIIITQIGNEPRTWTTPDKTKTFYYWPTETNQEGKWEIQTFNNKKPYIQLNSTIEVEYKLSKNGTCVITTTPNAKTSQSSYNPKSPQEQIKIARQVAAEAAISICKGRIGHKEEFIEYSSILSDLLSKWLFDHSPDQNKGMMASNALRRGAEYYVELKDEPESLQTAYKYIVKYAEAWLSYYETGIHVHFSILNKGNSQPTTGREGVVSKENLPPNDKERYQAI